MDNDTNTKPAPDALPVFPTSAPAVFCDADAATALFDDVLARLAAVVNIEEAQLAGPTPCQLYNVAQLRNHALGWLQFFAAALLDPEATGQRPDPEAFTVTAGSSPADIVNACSQQIQQAIRADVASTLVTMSSSRMAGDGVLAMALGEYIVHAWDIATATGQPYEAPAEAVGPAHKFLQGMVAPEYRGPDSGFFDEEVSVTEDASALDRLLGFAGRDPAWAG